MIPLLGALAGGVLSNLTSGGNQGCGMGGGLGNIIGKFLDPLGLLGGQEQGQQNGISQEDADKIIELLEELVAQGSEENESACDCEGCSSASDTSEDTCSDTCSDNWQNIFISTGSGDDTVTIG